MAASNNDPDQILKTLVYCANAAYIELSGPSEALKKEWKEQRLPTREEEIRNKYYVDAKINLSPEKCGEFNKLVRVARRLVDCSKIVGDQTNQPCEIQFFNNEGTDILLDKTKWKDIYTKFDGEFALYGDHTHWIMFYHKDLKYVVLSFRGTAVVRGNVSDLFSDVSIYPHLMNDVVHGTGMHRGFWTRMRNQYPIIRAIIAALGGECKKVYVTGHSLGGAIAQGFHIKWNDDFGEKMEGGLIKENWIKFRTTAFSLLKTHKKEVSESSEVDDKPEKKSADAEEEEPEKKSVDPEDDEPEKKSADAEDEEPEEKSVLCASCGSMIKEEDTPSISSIPPIVCVTFAAPAIIYSESSKKILERVIGFLNDVSRSSCYNFIYHNDVVPQLPIKLHDETFLSYFIDRAAEYPETPWWLGLVLLNFRGTIVSLLHNNFVHVAPFYRSVSTTFRLHPTTDSWLTYDADKLTESLLAGSPKRTNMKKNIFSYFTWWFTKELQSPTVNDDYSFEASKTSISDHSMSNYITAITAIKESPLLNDISL